MIIKLNGDFDEIPEDWAHIENLLAMMGRTSVQELPREIKDFSRKNSTVGISQTWLVLKNNSPKFIRSVSETHNTLDRPYDVTDEMEDRLKDSWFTSIKDIYAYSGGELYSAKLVRNFLSSFFKEEGDIASMIIDKNKNPAVYTENIYTRAWGYYFILNYRESLHEILKDKKRIGNIITFENVL